MEEEPTPLFRWLQTPAQQGQRALVFTRTCGKLFGRGKSTLSPSPFIRCHSNDEKFSSDSESVQAAGAGASYLPGKVSVATGSDQTFGFGDPLSERTRQSRCVVSILPTTRRTVLLVGSLKLRPKVSAAARNFPVLCSEEFPGFSLGQRPPSL